MVLPKDLNKNVVYLGPDKGVLGRFVKTTGLFTKKYFFEGSPDYGVSVGELERVVAETPEETKEREGKWAQIRAKNKQLQDADDARSAAKEEAARAARDAAEREKAAEEARKFYEPYERAAAASNGTPGGRRRRRSTSKRSSKKKSHTRRRRRHK